MTARYFPPTEPRDEMFHADGHFWFQDFVSSACDEEHRLVDLFAFESVIMSASAPLQTPAFWMAYSSSSLKLASLVRYQFTSHVRHHGPIQHRARLTRSV